MEPAAVQLLQPYRASDGGVRVVHADGGASQHRAGSIVIFTERPLEIHGPLIPLQGPHAPLETKV